MSQSRVVAPLLVALSFLASAALTAPFFYSKPSGSAAEEVRYAHDLMIHLAVVEQFDKVLRSGAIYPRWLPDVNYGYGNAWPNFYPPGFYYLTSLIHAITRNWIDALFVIAALGLAASGLAFYALARAFFGKPASAVAAILYALLPYHLIDFFWRGAFPEFLTFVLLPLILLCCYRVGSGKSAAAYAGLGLCYGSSLMVHTPVAYLFSYVLVLYAVMWAIARRDLRIALRIFAGMTIGVLLSAIYWLPAVLEIKYAAETVTSLFQYHKNYITELPGDGTYERLLRETFAIQAAALFFLVVAWRFARRSPGGSTTLDTGEETSAARLHVGIWGALGMLAVFMNLPVSYSVARLIPKIEIVAFPSRWLAFVCLFTALVTGALADLLLKRRGWRRPRLIHASAGAVLVIAIASNLWFSSQAVIIGSRSNPMVRPYSDFLVDTYCPKGTGATAALPRTERLTITPEAGQGEVIRWEPLIRDAVITADRAVTARFKTFDFPGWTASLDGRPVEISSDSARAQTIEVPPGRHAVRIMFAGTLPRKVGGFLSIIGGLVIIGLSMAARLRLGATKTARSPALTVSSETNMFGWGRLFGTSAAEAAASPASGSLNPTKTAFSICATVAILAAGGLCVVMLIDESHLLDRPAAPARSPGQVQRTMIVDGAMANLSVGRSDSVVVAADEMSLVDVLTAVARRDDRQLESLIQSGRAFRVAQNATVRVVRLSGGKANVAIVESDRASRDGWVLEGWLK